MEESRQDVSTGVEEGSAYASRDSAASDEPPSCGIDAPAQYDEGWAPRRLADGSQAEGRRHTSRASAGCRIGAAPSRHNFNLFVRAGFGFITQRGLKKGFFYLFPAKHKGLCNPSQTLNVN